MGRRARLITPPLSERFELNRDSPQALGLVGWYPTFPPTDALLWPDRGRGTLPLTLLSGAAKPTWQADAQLGGALLFASASSQGATEATAAPVTGAPLTLTCWYKPTTLVTATPISISDASNSVNNYDLRVLVAGTIQGAYQGATTLATRTSTGVLTAGSWSHLAVRLKQVAFSGTDWDCFLNGLLDNGSTAQAGTTAPSVNQLAVGKRGGTGTSYCNGAIADVRIYGSWLPDALLWQMYDPLTRFDLYQPVATRHYSIPAAGFLSFGFDPSPGFDSPARLLQRIGY